MRPNQIAIYSPDRWTDLENELRFYQSKILNLTATACWLQDDAVEPAWADCVWRNVQRLEIESISDAQRKLRQHAKKWLYFGDVLNRRGALIAEGLEGRKSERQSSAAPIPFPSRQASEKLPVFTMADANHVLWSDQITRRTPDGKIFFVENKTVPPSRAYLKLWEALTLLGDRPHEGDLVYDLGSSPGSWSWALAELGARVISIDRSPLSENVTSSKIEFRKGDAFSVTPTEAEWVFSDVICYPEKLYETVQAWIALGVCEKFVCNVKFTGAIDPAVADRFRRIPHSRILHLYNGKNELTWIRHPKL